MTYTLTLALQDSPSADTAPTLRTKVSKMQAETESILSPVFLSRLSVEETPILTLLVFEDVRNF